MTHVCPIKDIECRDPQCPKHPLGCKLEATTDPLPPKLLPCPFCGCNAKLCMNGMHNYIVECLGCFARSISWTESLTIERWNRRAPAAPGAGGKWTPREPTQEMLNATKGIRGVPPGAHDLSETYLRYLWITMHRAAAPPPERGERSNGVGRIRWRA